VRRIEDEAEFEYVLVGTHFAATIGKLHGMRPATKVRVRFIAVVIRLSARVMIRAIIDVDMNDMPVADLDHVR